jgi:hypothetical protein
MATAMSAKTLENLQHSTQLSPESQSYTPNSSHENLGTRMLSKSLQASSIPKQTGQTLKKKMAHGNCFCSSAVQ